jgi:hypothetical protein
MLHGNIILDTIYHLAPPPRFSSGLQGNCTCGDILLTQSLGHHHRKHKYLAQGMLSLDTRSQVQATVPGFLLIQISSVQMDNQPIIELLQAEVDENDQSFFRVLVDGFGMLPVQYQPKPSANNIVGVFARSSSLAGSV